MIGAIKNSADAEYNILVIDGHDKNTAGKRTFTFEDGSFMIENDHNEPVADELVRLFGLDDRFNVIYVTPEDTYTSIKKRADLCNEYYTEGGRKYNNWLCIPVHANAAPGATWVENAKGSEVLFNKGSKRGEHFAKCIAPKLSIAMGTNNRGIKPRTDVGILKYTDMPCVLTEAAFMTNKEEAQKLMDPKYRLAEAKAIYEGICEGFGVKPLDFDEPEKSLIIKYNPDQEEDLIIYSRHPIKADAIVEMIQGFKSVREYSTLELQDTLYKLGYHCGPLDGIPGKKTEAGISAFQRLNNLPETGVMDPKSIMVMEELKQTKPNHRTLWYNGSEIHVYMADLDEYEIGVGLGTFGELEKLSEMASEYDCAVNGQFFGGGREGLGALIIKGLFYFKPQNDLFSNWIEFKDRSVTVRDVSDAELYLLQRSTEFTIGTSWPLIIDGQYAEILKGGITHKFARHPRTLMASAGNLRFLIAVDGRRSNSLGMTAAECQDLLRFIEKVLGVKLENATNLDGGGSTEMIVNGVIVNVPSDGHERPVGTFIYLKRRA